MDISPTNEILNTLSFLHVFMIYIEDTETEIKKIKEPLLLVTRAKLNLSTFL